MIDLVGERTLPDLWREQVTLRGDHTWLVHEAADGTVTERTYAEVDTEVEALARGLRAAGVGHGDSVVLHLRNCPEFVVTWFALASLGAVMVPSNVANTATEVTEIAARSHAVALVTSASLWSAAGPATAALDGPALAVVVGEPPPDDRTGATPYADLLHPAGSSADTVAEPAERRAPASEDPVQILFTSGTTAAPKGVVVTHANLLWAGEGGAKGQGLDREDRLLTALPLFHVNGQAITVLSALTVGATVVLLEEFRPAAYLDQVRRHRATQTSLVAQQALALLREPRRDDDADHALRRVGFAINIDDERKIELESRFGVELINIYGLSEAMAVISMSPLHRPQRWPSVGLPALTRSVRVVDPTGAVLPPGEVGEIQVHGVPGRTVMAGYFEDPVATAAAVSDDGWVRTGDAGHLDAEGYLFFYERVKDVIKCSGQNVGASEVEAVLESHGAVAEAAVIGVPSERRGETVKAFVVAAPGGDLDVTAVLEHCGRHLARYKVPEFVEVVPALPRTSVGKLAKKELRRTS